MRLTWNAIARLAAVASVAAVLVGCRADQNKGTPADLTVFQKDRVAEVRITMAEDDWAAMTAGPLAKRYVPADFSLDVEVLRDVAVRPKGSSSLQAMAELGIPRFGLTVDFNLFNVARNFRGLSKVNLNTGFKYHFLLRARLASELFSEMGVPAPETAYADVWVNNTHLGVYALVEQVDRTFLRRHFPNDDGNLYKPAGLAGSLAWTGADLTEADEGGFKPLTTNLGGGSLGELLAALGRSGPQLAESGPRPGGLLAAAGLKTNENVADHSALLRFLDVLNSEPNATFPQAIEWVLDVNGALRFLAVSAMTVHLDSYLGSGQNYYLYETDGRFSVIPWDMNESFGTFHCGIERRRLIDLYIDEPTPGPLLDRPLVARLLSHPPYLDAYRGYLRALLDGPFAPGEIEARIDRLAGLIAPLIGPLQSAERRRVSELDYDLPRSTLRDSPAVAELKSFAVARAGSVRRQLSGTRPSSGDGSGNGATSAHCLDTA